MAMRFGQGNLDFRRFPEDRRAKPLGPLKAITGRQGRRPAPNIIAGLHLPTLANRDRVCRIGDPNVYSPDVDFSINAGELLRHRSGATQDRQSTKTKNFPKIRQCSPPMTTVEIISRNYFLRLVHNILYWRAYCKLF